MIACYFVIFICCIVVLVVLLEVVVIVLISLKRILYLNPHCVSLKSCHLTSKFRIVAMFVTADVTTGFHIRKQYRVFQDLWTLVQEVISQVFVIKNFRINM
jgi:hypothetical protein